MSAATHRPEGAAGGGRGDAPNVSVVTDAGAYDAGLELARRLIAHGVPVVVCRPVLNYAPGAPTDLIPPKGWNVITAEQCDLSRYRPGIDTLALVGGHGVDVVDIDAKAGASPADLPPFRHFGVVRTPSGGWHYYVPSTGMGKLSPFVVNGKVVGDYVGGTAAGGSRLLAYLPGSSRPKYPGGAYVIESPIDLEALFDSGPDEDLAELVAAAGASDDAEPGVPPASSDELKEFLAAYGARADRCPHGRELMADILTRAEKAKAASGGRHGWAVRSACRLVLHMRAGCTNATDVDLMRATLERIKPEGGTDLDAVMKWALTNASGWVECPEHGYLSAWDFAADSDGLDGLDGFPDGPRPLADILRDIEAFGRQYVAFPSEAAVVAWVLWVAHAHIIKLCDSTPRLGIVAPEKQSGKTRLLEVTETLVPHPMRVANVSTPVLYRSIDSSKPPTVLIDEADAIFAKGRDFEDLRSLVNAGHRRGNNVARMEGEGKAMKVREFRTFAAVALAGIGDLPDTIEDRSIILRMKRRAPHERVSRWRFRDGEAEGRTLRRELAAWASELESLPYVPDEPSIVDRKFEACEPMLAIADIAGDEWPARARIALGEMTTGSSTYVPLHARLLAHTWEVWPASSPFMSTSDLIAALKGLDESPWGEDGPLHPSGLNPEKLAWLLRHYGVAPKHSADKRTRGYHAGDFMDAWERYLPPLDPSSPSNPSVVARCDVCGEPLLEDMLGDGRHITCAATA